MNLQERSNHAHMVIIPTSEYYDALRDALSNIPPNTGMSCHPAINAILYHLVEACRVREAAILNIDVVGGQVENVVNQTLGHAPGYSSRAAQDLNKLVVKIGERIFEYIVAMNMYEEDGVLQYYQRPVQDPTFKEVALDYIQRLSWNKQFYEPVSRYTVYR